MAENQNFERERVNFIPTTGLVAGTRYDLNVGGGKYKTVVISNDLQPIIEAGAEFIEKDTMAQFRAISSREIWAIQNGYYKGVRLNGYYTKGDTPAPIEYYLSDTTESDDGGSVIEVTGVKLYSIDAFSSPNYFGLGIDKVTQQDITPFFKSYIKRFTDNSYKPIIMNGGNFKLTTTVSLPSNLFLDGGGASITAINTTGISLINKKNITISNLKLGVESESQTDFIIYGENSENIKITNSELFKGITAVRLLNCNKVWCTDNIVHDMTWWGFYHLGGEDIYIQNNTCYDNGRDGIKVAGNLSSGGELTVKNLNITNNICYNNGSDGIDVAINHLDGFYCSGNICRDNSLVGIDFKILNYTGGSVKNAFITNNQIIDNITRGLNIQNDLATNVPSIQPIYQIIVRDNLISGDNVAETAYACAIMIGNNSNTYAKFQYNDLFGYVDGLRVNNSNKVTIANNDISVKNRGIHLRNGTAENIINNPIIRDNKIYFSSGSGLGISVGDTDATLVGSITNFEIYNNTILGLGTNLRIVKHPSSTQSKYYNNSIGEYVGSNTVPSLPANKNDIVLSTDPSGKLLNSWICYADSLLDERKYYAQNTVDKYFLLSKKGTSANFPTLGTNDQGYEFWHTTNNRPQWWTGTAWYDPLRDAGISNKGLVNQSANVTNSDAALPSSDTASTATDVAGVVADLNDLIDKYNTMLTVVTELQSKLNAKLTNDRASSQQAST